MLLCLFQDKPAPGLTGLAKFAFFRLMFQICIVNGMSGGLIPFWDKIDWLLVSSIRSFKSNL